MQVTVFPRERVQNVPRWHKEYLGLKTFESWQKQEEAFSALPLLPKSRSSERIQLPYNPLYGKLPIPGAGGAGSDSCHQR